jgi:hypothetical protein
METCGETRKDGSPCTARALPGGRYCWAHDPALTEQRREKRAKGGANRATSRRLERKMPATLRPLLDKLYTALDGVADGSMTPQQGTSMASIASAIARIFETAELEQRLARLEGEHGRHRAG